MLYIYYSTVIKTNNYLLKYNNKIVIMSSNLENTGKIILPKKGRPSMSVNLTDEEKKHQKREYSRKYYSEHKAAINANNKKCRELRKQLLITARNLINAEKPDLTE